MTDMDSLSYNDNISPSEYPNNMAIRHQGHELNSDVLYILNKMSPKWQNKLHKSNITLMLWI